MHLLVAALEHAQFSTSASNLDLSACSTQQQLGPVSVDGHFDVCFSKCVNR